MTLKKKPRNSHAEVKAWLQQQRKASVRTIAHELDIPDVTVYSALLRLERESLADRYGEERVKDARGRLAPTPSVLWGAADLEGARDEIPALAGLGIVERALAARPPELPRWLGGAA